MAVVVVARDRVEELFNFVFLGWGPVVTQTATVFEQSIILALHSWGHRQGTSMGWGSFLREAKMTNVVIIQL